MTLTPLRTGPRHTSAHALASSLHVGMSGSSSASSMRVMAASRPVNATSASRSMRTCARVLPRSEPHGTHIGNLLSLLETLDTACDVDQPKLNEPSRLIPQHGRDHRRNCANVHPFVWRLTLLDCPCPSITTSFEMRDNCAMPWLNRVPICVTVLYCRIREHS